MFQTLLEGFGQVLDFLFRIVGDYGVAIILLTILIRVLLLPLTIKQTRSMAQMQQIQPLIKEIQKKHKGDRQKMNEELMKVYKEHKVNPLGGCLPLLMQLPFFFALYAVLIGDPAKAVERFGEGAAKAVAHLPSITEGLGRAIQSGTADFLGFMDLSCTPSTAGRSCGTLGWVGAVPYFVLVALMVGTTWYQQKQMQRMSGQVNPQMVMMGRIMPIFLGFISLSIPAGVLLYWVTTNLWQVGQQRVMMGQRAAAASADGQKAVKGDSAPVKPPPTLPAKGRPPAKRGGSGRSGGGSRKKRRKR